VGLAKARYAIGGYRVVHVDILGWVTKRHIYFSQVGNDDTVTFALAVSNLDDSYPSVHVMGKGSLTAVIDRTGEV
jgi:hypothetical protein